MGAGGSSPSLSSRESSNASDFKRASWRTMVSSHSASMVLLRRRKSITLISADRGFRSSCPSHDSSRAYRAMVPAGGRSSCPTQAQPRAVPSSRNTRCNRNRYGTWAPSRSRTRQVMGAVFPASKACCQY